MGSHCCVCRTETFCILRPIIFLPLSISYLHKSNEMSPHSTHIYRAPTVLCVLRPWRCSRAKGQRSSPSQASPVLGAQAAETNKGSTQRLEGVTALSHCLATTARSAAADTQADHLWRPWPGALAPPSWAFHSGNDPGVGQAAFSSPSSLTRALANLRALADSLVIQSRQQQDSRLSLDSRRSHVCQPQASPQHPGHLL